MAQRRREIGVRMALGAQAAQVRGIVVAHAAKVAGIGMIVGLAGALALAQLLRGLVFGVPSRDPVVFVVVTLVLGAVVVVAGYVPARRAVRTNPLESLRAD